MQPFADAATQLCPYCGEEVEVELDPIGASSETYIEDCPVCCNPNVIHAEFFGPDEPPRLWAEAE